MRYPIQIEKDFHGLLPLLEREAPLNNRNVMIITDSQVGALYASTLQSLLAPSCRAVFLSTFPAGERHKNLDTVRRLLTALTERHFDRKDLILALGGGVTGDIAGFAAAVYMRGIAFIQLPTSLLAQVDSSIGGKTGVDFNGYKNLIGAFHEPAGVYMNLSLLKTLPEREFTCGLGEILKHALLASKDYYVWLTANREKILQKDQDTLALMIQKSCQIKAHIVEQDFKESGVRASLNFGHTLGHAIERECGFSLSHGACVAVGMVGAVFLSVKKEMISWETLEEVKQFLLSFGLPVSVGGLAEDAVLAAAKADKKNRHGAFRFVLLREIGKVAVNVTVTGEELREAIRYIVK